MTLQKWFTHPVGLVVSALTATILWGSAIPFVKLSYGQLHIAKEDMFEQILFAGYRFALAGFLLLVIVRISSYGAERKKRQAAEIAGVSSGRVSFWRISRLALVQTFLQYLLFYIGIMHSSGIQGAILSGSASFFQMLFAQAMYRNEPFTRRKIIGLLLGFLGVFAVGFGQGGGLHFEFGFGEVCLLLSAAFGALGNVLARHEARYASVLPLTGKQMLLGGLALAAIGIGKRGFLPFQFQTVSLIIFIYLALVSALAFGIWNMVMKYNQVGKVSMYLFLIPVFGVILSSIILGETIHLFVLAALASVVAGIIIVNRAV
ncbi:DMT family transporter [Paenibacillus sp. FSL R10-2734]|uniref:DMT family transporter n=1 Tax=Paenibacillus sp. FSL R10-2734 TaxID=2954691 RepID=UPI0030D860C6